MPARGEPHSFPVQIGAERVQAAPAEPLDMVWDALGRVYDPELGLDVVSLGLVYDVRRESDQLVVEMTLTTPGCPASESLPDMARAAIVVAVGDAVDVDVRVVWDPPWNTTMMSDDAQVAFGFRRR